MKSGPQRKQISLNTHAWFYPTGRALDYKFFTVKLTSSKEWIYVKMVYTGLRSLALSLPVFLESRSKGFWTWLARVPLPCATCWWSRIDKFGTGSAASRELHFHWPAFNNCSCGALCWPSIVQGKILGVCTLEDSWQILYFIKQTTKQEPLFWTACVRSLKQRKRNTFFSYQTHLVNSPSIMCLFMQQIFPVYLFCVSHIVGAQTDRSLAGLRRTAHSLEEETHQNSQMAQFN